MACELNTEKYISVVEKLIKLDAAEYTNFDNVAKFVLNSSLSDEQKKMSLHNISHIFNSLYALDNSAYELGKAHEVMANVSVIENTEEYLKLTASTFEVKEPVSPSLSNLNAAINKLQNSTSLMPDDLKKDIVPLIAKYMSSTQFDSDEERKESFDKIKMHVVTVINSFGEDAAYKRILLKTFYDAVENLKSSSIYINLDEIADKVGLDNTLVVLKTGEIFEAVTVDSTIKIISEDGSLVDVAPEDIAYSKIARNTSSFFSNAQGQHKFQEGTLSSAFTITAVEDSEQESINAALNKMTSSKGVRITRVPLSLIGSERIERVHDLAREEEGMSPLLNRKHETFETPAQQKKLANKKSAQVLTVARPTYLEQGHAFMGEIVETGQRFYIYSFDNYAVVDGENNTMLVDFTKPVHKELVKELSVKQTSAGEVSLTDTDLANIENAVKYYNDFKEEVKYAPDEDVSDVFFKYYDLQHQRGTRVVTPLTQEVKNDKTLTTPVTVITENKETGEKTEELYNLPVYIYKKYNEQTGELEYVHKTVLAQNQLIKYTGEDGVAKEVSEMIYVRDALKVNDSVYQEFFGEEDVQLKNSKEKGVVSKRQTSNFLITFKDNGKLGYRIVEPKRIMENLEYFPQFVVMLAEALSLESKFTAVKEFDKNGMAFPVRKGLAVSLAINPNRNGKLFLEFRPYGPQYADIITKDNKGKFGIEINVPFIKVSAETLFGEKSEIYKNVISDYPALAGLNSAEFFEKAFDLMETSDVKDSLKKLRNKADASMSLFSKDIAKAFTDNMESMGEGTDFMKVLREQYTFSDGVFRPEELLFTRNSKNELIPRIQFAFNNVTGEPKFNRAYKNLNVISTTSPRKFAIVPRENIEVAPETSEIIETSYPIEVKTPEPIVPTTSSEDLGLDIEDEEMNFSMEEGTTPATASDIISETSWLKENLPQFDVMIAYLEEVLDLTKVDGTVLGAYKDKVIYLDKMLAAKGTLYHEAFHGVFRNIFTSEKRRELLDSVKSAAKNKTRFTEAALKEYARKINKPYSKEQMEDIVAEEILAEGFQNYMLGKNKPTGLLKQLFEALKKLINMFNKKSSEIDAVYSNIRTGHYKNAVIKSEMFKGQTAFELIPGLKRFSLNDAGTVTRAQTALTPSEQNGLTNFIVGEIAATASTDTFDEQFERAVDKVLNEVFDISNLIRQKPSAEATIIAKYGPRYANFRFVLGARAKGLPVFDVNYTEKEELNGVVEKNTVVGPDNNPLDNTLGNYSKELLKKSVKQKFELLDSIKVEKEENEDEENEINEELIGKALDESKGVLDTQAEEIADETKDSADFEKSFNEHNRVDSYVSHLRRYISAIRSDITDKELGIKVPQMIDGDAIFTTLMKVTADVNPSDIIETLKVAADIMIEDGFAEQGHQIKALYNKIVKDSVIVDGKPTKNKQIHNILVEVLHGLELDYAMFNVTTPGKTDDEFSEQAPFSFTLKDKVVDEDTRKKRDNIISALLIGFKANASKPEYKAAALELAKKCALIGKTESSILAGLYGQSVEAERLTKELADLMAVIDLKLPKTLIKASLLAIEEKDLKQTLELTPDLDSFYKMNDKFISEKQYLEKEFFLDLAVVLNNMYIKSGVNPSFVDYLDDQNKSLGRFNSILKSASVFALKYDPTEIPSVIRNAEGKPIYRYTKYTPLATVTQQLRREGLAATLQKDEFYEDYLLDFMLDNPMFADLLKEGKENTPEAKKAKLLLDNIKIALFGGVQQIQGKNFTEGKSFANVDERSLYILNILSFLNRTTLKDSTGTTIDTYMRSYHQVEATQTNFLMTAMHESLIGFTHVVAGSKNKYEREGKATYKGRLAIVKDLESIVKQEFNRIKRESNKDTIKRRVDKYNAGDKTHNLVLKYNAILDKDGVTVITEGNGLRAYTFNILDTFFDDKTNESLKTALIEAAKSQSEFSDLPEDTYNDLLNKLNQHAESEFNNHLQKLEQLDLIKNVEVQQPEGFAPVEFYTSELLSKKLRRAGTDGQDLSEVYPKVPGQPKQNNDVTEALLFDHFFNYWRNTLHVNQIFDGDIAVSIKNAQDYVKRQKKLAASGSNMKEGTHKVSYLNTIVGYINRKYPQYGPYYSRQELENDTLIPADVKQYLLQEYGGKDHMFEVFDGQSISSLMHQMDMYDTLGRLDETAKKLLIAKHYRNLTEKETKYLKGLKIVNNSKKTITATRFQYHKLSESYIDRNDVSYLNVPEDQVEKTYEVLDRLYSNIYENRKSLQEARDNGNTSEEKEFEDLIKQDVKEIHAYYKPLPHRKHMHKLLNSMEYHIIDQVMDTTANKNANKLPVDFFANKTGEPGYLNLELSSINVQNSGKYMQVETSGVKDKSKVSVQKKLLIAADIEKIRELIRIDLAKGGLPYTESEKKAVELLADTLAGYQKSLKDGAESRLSYLQNVMREGGHFDIAKVFNLIQDNLIAQNSPSSMIKMFDVVNGKPVLSPNLTVLRNTLEYYFFSQYSKHVTDEKASGFKNFHESSFGYEVVVDENNNVIPTEIVRANPEAFEGNKTRNLGVTIEVDEKTGVKTYFIEAIFPMPNFKNEKQKLFYKEKLTKMFGVRIPTEDKRSMIAIKAVDFVDASKGNAVIVPHLVHILSGSDFDIDSLFGQMLSYYEDAAGNFNVYGDYTNFANPMQGKYVEFIAYMKKKSEFKAVIKAKTKELSAISKEEGDLSFYNEVDRILEFSGVSQEEINNPSVKTYEKMIEIQAVLEVFSKYKLPVSFEQFSENPMFAGMVADKFQNQNLNDSIDIMSNEAVFKRLFINQQSSVQVFKDILTSFGIDLDVITKKGNLFSIDSVVASKIENAMNKDGIGLTAVLNKFLAVASEHGLELQSPVWKYTDINTKKQLEFSKYGGFNADEERTIALIGNILGMFADGAKEPIGTALQMNTVNAATVLSMVGLGIDPAFAFALNFIPEIKKAAADVQQAQFAITDKQDVNRLFLATEVGNQIDKLLKDNPSAYQNLVNAGLLVLDPYKMSRGLDIDKDALALSFAPKHVDLGRLKDGMLTVNEIGFDVDNITGDAHLNDAEKKIVLMALYMEQAQQTSVNQSVASLTNFFKTLQPSFKATDKILETLERLLDPEDRLIFTDDSVRRMFNENSVFQTAVKTFFDLDAESKRIFLERTPTFAPLVKAFGSYFDELRDVAEVITGYIGVSQFVNEMPGSRKSTNKKLQDLIDEDDANLAKSFKADYWFLNDLPEELEKFKEMYPENKFLKLLRTAFADTETAKVAKSDGSVVSVKQRYIKLIGKTKITGAFATEFVDDVNFLFNYASPEAKMFIKKLFYHELARTGLHSKKGSFLKYLPQELQVPLSDRIQTFVDRINNKEKIENIIQDTGSASPEQFAKALIEQMNYAVVLKEGKSKVKQFPMIDLSEDSYILNFADDIEGAKAKADHVESAILKVFGGTGKLPVGFKATLKKFTAEMFGDNFTMDFDRDGLSTSEEMIGEHFASRLGIIQDGETKLRVFPLMFRVNGVFYALKALDDIKLEKRFIDNMSTMAMGNKAVYEKVIGVPNTEVLSPLGFSREELTRYELISNRKLIIGNEEAVTKANKTESFDEDADFDIPEEDEDTFEQSGSLASLGLAPASVTEDEEDDFDMPEDGEGSGSLASLGFNFDASLKKESNELPTTNTISTPEKPIEIYSDGSDIKGTGRIGFGAVFVHNGKEYSLSGTEASEDVAHMKRLFPEAKFSNPTMEMLALVKALENFTGRGEHIIINQDYKGAVNYNGLWDKSEGSAQRDPKPWKSKEAYITYLVNRAEDAIASIEEAGGSVKLTWVKGHSGNIMNEKADQAAKAREEFDTFEDVYKENDNDNTPCQGGAPF